MTSHIDDTPSEFSESSSSRYKVQVEEMSPREKLIAKLQTHLSQVQSEGGKPGGKHEHKANVLQVAIDVLKGNSTVDDLRQAKIDNPRYDSSIGFSTTKKLVNEALQMGESMQQEQEHGKGIGYR